MSDEHALEGPPIWTLADQSVSVHTPAPPTIVIQGADRQPLVSIHPDGTLEYGPGYEPDAAARTFWDALRRYMPARCPNCGCVGTEEAS
jgi:hypothetical protein